MSPTRDDSSRCRLPRAAVGAFLTRWVVGIALAGAGGAAWAQDLVPPDQELEDLLKIDLRVWSASKTEMNSSEVPSVVTVLSREDLLAWRYDSVADVLSNVLGFYLMDDFVIPNAAVRGMSGGMWSESGMLKVLIDGHSVAFRATGGNWLGPEFVPISAVERIEIVRGPVSALYGADAFLGVINVITRSGEQVRGVDLSFGVVSAQGNLGADIDASVGGEIEALDYVLSYRQNDVDFAGLELPESSPRPNLADRSMVADRASERLSQTSRVGTAKFAMNVGDAKLILTGYLSAIERDAEFAPWLQLANRLDSSGRTRQNRVALLNGQLASSLALPVTPTFELALDTTAFHGRTMPRDTLDVGSDVYFVERSMGFWGVDATLEGRWKPSSSFGAIGGIGLIVDHEQLPSILRILKPSANNMLDPSSANLGSARATRNFVNPAVHFQATWTPIEHQLTLLGGVRLDWHNLYGSALSGRIGTVSRLMDFLTAKVIYGYAYKAPSPFLLHAVPLRAGDVLGNQELAPQFIHSAEGQLLFWSGSVVSMSTGLAYNYLIDKAQFSSQGVNTTAKNIAATATLSWESELRIRAWTWIEAYLTTQFVRGSRATGYEGYQARLIGTDNDTFPSMIVHGGVHFFHQMSPVSLMVRSSFIGKRRASDDNILQRGARYDLPSYFLLNAGLTTEAVTLFGTGKTTFAASVSNILDVKAADPGYMGFDLPVRPRILVFEARHYF